VLEVLDVLGDDEAVLAGDDAVEVVEVVDEPDGLEDPPFPPRFEGLEYRSAYQPPPLRMKLPAEICRRAVFS
jgi:hypothetical protein